ncbi:hypothetical protein K439DRAFT_1626401 [Ramaria rubella]|nr:hypothetical protein K439DRAFT_1626401 [Ramaria rubella]
MNPLPANPTLYNQATTSSKDGYQTTCAQDPSRGVGAIAAQALTTSLANPYGQTSYTNANYHSYFTQMQRPMTTAQGYTLSSTYVPNVGGASSIPQSQPWPRSQRGRTPNASTLPAPRVSRPFSEQYFSVPGDTRCSHDGCSFTGSKKNVEVHMMDRHLVFPPGWKKRNNDWDADPSLKGKPVPIPGTGLTLNTPEAVDAWIAERKKRWPSKEHVEDKKRKAQEAVDRGEIDLTLKGRKRQKMDDGSHGLVNRGRGWRQERGRGRGGGRGRGRGRDDANYGRPDSGWRGRGRDRDEGSALRSRINPTSGETSGQGIALLKGTISSSDNSSASSTSDSDVDPVKDAVSSKVHDPDFPSDLTTEESSQQNKQINKGDDPSVASALDLSDPERRPIWKRKPAAQPKALPQNPFATRPSLLRNLLLPEIRHTVSNLSQAIHFLVENDFLKNVELKPGDADSPRIKVLKSTRFETDVVEVRTDDPASVNVA